MWVPLEHKYIGKQDYNSLSSFFDYLSYIMIKIVLYIFFSLTSSICFIVTI